MARVAGAQAYPTRPVRIIVGFAAGGTSDIGARLIGQSLQERLGQPFVIENRPGAATNIATEMVVRSAPDGYTLLMVGPSATINTTLYDKLSFVFLRDTVPVASLYRQPQIMVAHPSLPAKTIPELIAYAKANPGKITMASAGTGSFGHLAGEMFKMMAGVDMLHVPYRGAAPALTDLVGGQVLTAVTGTTGAIEYVKSANAARTRRHHFGARRRAARGADHGRVSSRLRGRAICSASARRGTRPPRSSASSTGRSTRRSPIPSSRRVSPISAGRRLRSPRPNTASSSRAKRRSGRR